MPTHNPEINEHDPSKGLFWSTPATDMGAEIDMLAPQFAQIGIPDPHSTVMMWIGKTDRFTSMVIRTPQEVLAYISAEIAHQNKLVQQRQGDAGVAPAGVVNKNVDSDIDLQIAWRQYRAAEKHRTNSEWRSAIVERRAAIANWDIYLQSKRDAFKATELMPIRVPDGWEPPQ